MLTFVPVLLDYSLPKLSNFFCKLKLLTNNPLETCLPNKYYENNGIVVNKSIEKLIQVSSYQTLFGTDNKLKNVKRNYKRVKSKNNRAISYLCCVIVL